MTNNQLTKQYSLSSLGGRMVVFFSLIAFGVVGFSVFLFWESSQTDEGIRKIEEVYYPLSATLEGLNTDFDRYVSLIRQTALSGDTTGVWRSHQLKETFITAGLDRIREQKESFSPSRRADVDSLEGIIARTEQMNQAIARMLADRRTAAQLDSTAVQPDSLALPNQDAETSFFLETQLAGLDRLQQRYDHSQEALLFEVDQRLKDNTLAIRNQTRGMLWVWIAVGCGVLVILIAGGYWLMHKFNKSLSRAIGILDLLVKGQTSEHTDSGTDEFRSIVDAANNLSGNLQRASAFAQSIGEGNVSFEFKPVTENDLLGNSLVQMRQKLKEINEADKKRNWSTAGLAKFADIMRRNEDYRALANTLVSELVKYTKSNQGGMFILNQEKEEDQYLELIACYAFEREKFLKQRAEIGEGLVGQCYLERRTIYLKEIPQHYVTITSGLGGANPSSLLIVPLKVNDLVEGVLEMASFKEYQPHEIEFVEQVGEIIASTISNARINDRTRRLLEESQQHSEELRAQEEEMRQNMEEMQATQEQMHRQTEEMKKMQVNLELEKSMFRVLMEHLPDRITYKDTDSRILRINKSKSEKFRMSPEEMVGKTDYDFFSKEHADRAFREEQELIRSGVPLLNTEERAVFANGDIAWATTSRIPFKNDHNETVGMFIITKDITQLKTAELAVKDRDRIIERLLDGMPIFRFTVARDGLLHDVWKAAGLTDLPSLESKPVEQALPEVHDLIRQEGLQDSDLVCKGVLEINEEKEVFKYYLFRESAFDGVFLGFGLKQ